MKDEWDQMPRKHILILFCLIIITGCGATKKITHEYADTIYIGEHIITMDETTPTAIAIKGQHVLATGTVEEMQALTDADTQVIQLGEKALLPGFIDAHGHVSIQARLLGTANLSPPPVGTVTSIEEMKAHLKQYIIDNEVPEGTWVIGFGYDESLLREQRHPTRADLDEVSTRHPIMLIHVSAHFVAMNSLALKIHAISAASPDPSGGRIRRWPDSQEPNGVLEEAAAQAVTFRQLLSDSSGFADQVKQVLDYYASFGITTAQEGATSMGDVQTFRELDATNALAIDLVAYPYIALLSAKQKESISAEPYQNRFRIGGVKFILDGSIQGKTGFLSQPYFPTSPNESTTNTGYSSISPEQYQSWLTPLVRRNVPIMVHANGDAAIDMMMDGFETALDGMDMPDHRGVIIHAQMMREDQLDRVARLHLIPSYFSAHPFFWGDWHRKILGDERAKRISPIRSTVERGIPFTIHNDTPIIPPDMMFLLWVTVNRQTRSGTILGPEQRATVMEALYAMTQGAAYQLFEEDSKGSITPGKWADMVILAADPTEVDPMELKDIPVLETISHGKTVFSKDQ